MDVYEGTRKWGKKKEYIIIIIKYKFILHLSSILDIKYREWIYK